MIIRSLSRKAPTFSQLASYIGQSGEGGTERCFSRNLYYDGKDQSTVSGLFWDNYQHLPERKNGNALYHEIIVLEAQPHLDRSRQVQILRDLAHEYCERRAPMQLAWGRVHFDTDYPHIHLMISSNEIGSKQRKRLDRQSFNDIQKGLESYKERAWPELVEQPIYNKAVAQRVKVKTPEGEMIRRTGKPSQKQQIADAVENLMAKARDLAGFKAALRRKGLSLYKRGQSWGIEHASSGKRYRLKTLGITESPDQFFKRRDLPDLPKQTKTKPSREEELLRARDQMERHAAEQLRAIEHDDSEGYER